MLREWYELVRKEFRGYGRPSFQKDLAAGVTVAAVALPLALAFGVASGADAAAGLVTAIIAGIVIGSLGGAPYQISGPTGAMSAVLIVLASRYGLSAIWVAGVLAGIMMVVLAVFRLGRVVSLIPAPVISGFTSGIAIIILFGQVENFLGVQLPPAESVLKKLEVYRTAGLNPDPHAVAAALIVIGVMLAAPRLPMIRRLPTSLLGIVAATLVVTLAGWEIPQIGSIPRSILLENRLSLQGIEWETFTALLVPAMSIAALGTIESLLSGAVAGNMTGIRMHNSVELGAQGIGNILIPFFGGVPATAAIARTSVNVKTGAITRMSSIVHSIVLLLAALFFAPWIERVPLAALAGVLVVTAWRMNEWHSIRFFFAKRLKHAIFAFSITLAATVLLDLTQAIVIGFGISSLIFMAQMSDLQIVRQTVDLEKLQSGGRRFSHPIQSIAVYYLSGPLFFGAARKLIDRLEQDDSAESIVILSMRGVPLVDATGVEVLREALGRQTKGGGRLLIAALQPRVEALLSRTGFLEEIGAVSVFWSSDRAILSLHAEPPEESPAVADVSALESTLVITPHEDRTDQQL